MFWATSSACARSSATSSTRWRSTWAGARPGVRRRRTGACIPAWQSQARWGDTGCLGAGCTQRQPADGTASSSSLRFCQRALDVWSAGCAWAIPRPSCQSCTTYCCASVGTWRWTWRPAAMRRAAPQGGWTRARSARPQGGLSACQRRCSQRLGRCRLPGTPCHRPCTSARPPAGRLTGARPRAAARQDRRAVPGGGAEACAGPFPAQACAHLRPVPGAGAPQRAPAPPTQSD